MAGHYKMSFKSEKVVWPKEINVREADLVHFHFFLLKINAQTINSV